MNQKKSSIYKGFTRIAIICSLLGVWGCSTLPTASGTQTPKDAAQNGYSMLIQNSFNYESTGSSKLIQDTNKKPSRKVEEKRAPEAIDLNDSYDVESTLDDLLNPEERNSSGPSFESAFTSLMQHVLNNSTSTAKGAFYPKEMKLDGFVQSELKMRNIQASLNVPYAVDIKQETITVGLYDLMPMLGNKGKAFQDKAVIIQGKDYREVHQGMQFVAQNWNKILGATQDSWSQIDSGAFTDIALTQADRAAGGQRKVRFAPTKENIRQIAKGLSGGLGTDIEREVSSTLDLFWEDEISNVYFDFVLNRQGQLVKLDQTMSIPFPSFISQVFLGGKDGDVKQISQSSTTFSNFGRAKPVFNPKANEMVSAREIESIMTGKSIAELDAKHAKRAEYADDYDDEYSEDAEAAVEVAPPPRKTKAPKAKKPSTAKGKQKAAKK